jgi:uncharacterized protein (TIGR03437 family)
LNALVGVFLAPTIDTRNSPATLNFSGAARDLTRVEPLLQQVFYVGNGLTSTGAARQIVVPAGATRLYLGYLDGNLTTNAGSFVVGVSTGASDSPQITSAGIVSAAGFGPAPLSGGALASIFGTNLGTANNATTVPLPTALGDTQVYFNTTPAPLFFVSGSQINAQIPYELRNEKRLLVTVTRGNNAGVPAPLDLTEFAPGIFTTTDGPIISDLTAGRLVTRDQPVRRGDTIVMYATGLGPVLYDAASGTAAADDRLSSALLPIQLVLASSGANRVAFSPGFAGLAPGLIGVFQLNATIPADAPTGSVQLSIQSAAGRSPDVTIAIQ